MSQALVRGSGTASVLPPKLPKGGAVLWRRRFRKFQPPSCTNLNPSCNSRSSIAMLYDVRLVKFRTYHCGPRNTVASLRFAFVNPPEPGGGFNVRDAACCNPGGTFACHQGGNDADAICTLSCPILATSTIAHAQDQTVSVGSWTIATSSKADKFDSCTMSRSTNDLDITFLRLHDGLLLLLDLSKWKLERGKTYDVTLLAGSRSV